MHIPQWVVDLFWPAITYVAGFLTREIVKYGMSWLPKKKRDDFNFTVSDDNHRLKNVTFEFQDGPKRMTVAAGPSTDNTGQ
jgi:hypothetical protein